jgi:negative regulator of sigma-B (phosphoserine phosphatase)
MPSQVPHVSPLIEWGVAARESDGRAERGNQYLVKPFPNGVLVAVVDGLGHGPRATAALTTAVSTLKGHAHESIALLLTRCHEELGKSRGVVMSLASFNAQDSTMAWLGIGNVKGMLLGTQGEANPTRERLVLHGGVVGHQLPKLRPAVIPVTRGNTLIFATHSLHSVFDEELDPGDPPQQVADHVLARYGEETDNALVLVARYAR